MYKYLCNSKVNQILGVTGYPTPLLSDRQFDCILFMRMMKHTNNLPLGPIPLFTNNVSWRKRRASQGPKVSELLKSPVQQSPLLEDGLDLVVVAHR